LQGLCDHTFIVFATHRIIADATEVDFYFHFPI